MRSLEADGFRWSALVLVIATAVMAAWLVWLFTAQVARYEISRQARLEVDRTAHPVQAPVSGRVVSSRLAMGRQVKAGDLLVELETDSQSFQIQEARTRLLALSPQIESLTSEMAAADLARTEEQETSRISEDVLRAQLQEAEAMSRLANEELRRMGLLRAEGILSESDFRKSKAESERRQSAVDALQQSIRRLGPEQRMKDSDRNSRLKQVRAELARLEGERITSEATIRRLTYEVERRSLRAPVAGKLAEVAILRAGGFVTDGMTLAMILPAGGIRAVAEFPPAAAMGRIQAGQTALLRLDGFPWAQYGSVRATVSDVASEVRNGWVRVEFQVHPAADSRIPMQHGLPGSVEVRVEQVSPANLALRAAGRLMASQRSWAEPATGADSSLR
jgi:membrane fusion protein (multidrug efflux system)